MKKLFFLGALFAVGLGFTACSSDKDEVADNSPSREGDGYISLAINLPSTSTLTRAANDNFDDGLKEEYAVSDVSIVLFNGNTSSSTVQAVYTPTLSWNKEGTSTDQITTVAKLIQSVTYSSTSYYALVILNKPTGLTISVGDTWSTVQAKTLTTTVSTANAALVQGTMMMANAPLADDDGGTNNPSSANVSTLVEIPSSKIFATEAEARSDANPVEVYVERVAAKVTIANASGTTTTGSLAWSLAGWMLDNTNPTSYAIRNTDGMTTFFPLSSNLIVSSGNIVSGANEYRFVGSAPVRTGKSLYRTYWAKDPNYDDNVTLLDFTGTSFSTSYGETNPKYCFENTFDVAHQTHHNTTRVVVQVEFNSGSDCFTVNGDAASVYTSKNDMETAVKAFVLGNADMADLIGTAGNIDITNANYIANGNKVGASNITLTWTSEANAGTWTLSDIAFDCLTSAGTTAYNASTFKSDLIDAINSAAVVSCYKDGISYYPIRIKHFGDDLTPWSAADHRTATHSYEDEGTSPTSRYLGRYGVLRNNWYHLNITSISQIGSPTCPAVPGISEDVPDDQVYSYIAVKINVLSWAKRTQDVTL